MLRYVEHLLNLKKPDLLTLDYIASYHSLDQAVYTVLREAENRSTAPIPVWEIPIWKDVSPRLKKVNAALKLINDTLDDLIAICKVNAACFLRLCFM